MDISKFNIVTYIKPNHDFDIFSKSLARIQKSKHLDKIYISFVKELSNEFKNELNRYDNIIWKDGVDEYWALEMKKLIDAQTSPYYYIWEEDSDIYDIEEFDSSYEYLISKGIDFLMTQDLKWIKRAEHLLENNLAVKDGKFIYFNWGTQYAKFCRESSLDRLINCAYPVTVNGIFSKNLIVSLLDYLMKSEYWEKITKGDFNHYHRNPKLPHSFEVFPGFWWEGINDGYGNVEYIATVSTKQYGRELGDRLVNNNGGELGDRLVSKLKRDVINIVGYNDWYTQKPWCREEINQKDFNVVYNQNKSDITYYIKDGIYKINDNIDSKINIALLTECRLMDPNRYKFIEDNSNLFDYIVTYDDELIDKFKEKVIITPYGGTWIWPIEKQNIYNKNKICSYICSNKNYTKDQIMRINILNYFYQNPHPNIELFGRGHNPLPENHEDGHYDGKILALKDFAFSLVIENHIQNNYFSEKLLDCLLTGTIPIYHGCKKISEYFNIEGFILFQNENEVKDIIENLNIEEYNKRKNAIKENFKLAKKYRDSVQYSFKKLKNGILH